MLPPGRPAGAARPEGTPAPPRAGWGLSLRELLSMAARWAPVSRRGGPAGRASSGPRTATSACPRCHLAAPWQPSTSPSASRAGSARRRRHLPGRPRRPQAARTPAQHMHILAPLFRCGLSSRPISPLTPIGRTSASRSAQAPRRPAPRRPATRALAHVPLCPCPAPILQSPIRHSPRRRRPAGRRRATRPVVGQRAGSVNSVARTA